MVCLEFEFQQSELLGSVNLKPAACLSIHIIGCMERHSVLNAFCAWCVSKCCFQTCSEKKPF